MTGLMDNPEGATPLDPNELSGLLYQHVSTRGELDQLEQANITEGLRWLNKQKTPNVLTEGFVCELHKRLFSKVWQWAGSFRTTEKNIGVDPTQIAIKLRQLLDDTQYWIENKTYSPKEIGARFHHRLVFIHPFPNGNGRHARIMADAILTKLVGHAPIDWRCGHALETMNMRRRQYITALRSADAHNYALLLAFVGA